jgi:aspartyl-tRNA(Asn)/glutamyl-tRNA(Gln) amidotransferase subunit C
MSITKEQVIKTARLANLDLNDETLEQMFTELNKILEVIDSLQQVNTDAVEPLINVSEFDLPLCKDEVSDGDITDKLFKNAPKEILHHFAVPKVIE